MAPSTIHLMRSISSKGWAEAQPHPSELEGPAEAADQAGHVGSSDRPGRVPAPGVDPEALAPLPSTPTGGLDRPEPLSIGLGGLLFVGVLFGSREGHIPGLRSKHSGMESGNGPRLGAASRWTRPGSSRRQRVAAPAGSAIPSQQRLKIRRTPQEGAGSEPAAPRSAPMNEKRRAGGCDWGSRRPGPVMLVSRGS